MNLVDFVFPYIEPLNMDEKKAQEKSLAADIAAINAAKFSDQPDRALAEAQRVADAETARVRTAETKATTYLAVLAALVPLIVAFQAATWENKAGPAPTAVKLTVLAAATVYLAAAGYHAFRTLQVSGFQRVVEGEIAAAWRTSRPLERLTRATLLASRRSRDTVNRKVTSIKVTHEHLIRAFAAFVLLLALDPIFYAVNWTRTEAKMSTTVNPVKTVPTAALTPAATATDRHTSQSGVTKSVEQSSTEVGKGSIRPVKAAV
jgi:hypothetical protein